MKGNAWSLFAGLQRCAEDGMCEVSKRIVRVYSHDDPVAANEVISKLEREGWAIVVRNLNDAEDDEVCLLMVDYPGGGSPFDGWKKSFSRLVSDSRYFRSNPVTDTQMETEKESNQSVQTRPTSRPA